MSNSYAANLTNHNPTVYSTNASFVYSAKYTQAVLGLLDAKPGDRIVDLGCGTGELTRGIAGVVGEKGRVVGIDSSESMVSLFLPAALAGNRMTDDALSSLSKPNRPIPQTSLSDITKPIFRPSTRQAKYLKSSNIRSIKSSHRPRYIGAKRTQVGSWKR